MVAGELDLHNREQVPVPCDRDHAGDHDEQVSVHGDNGGDDDFSSDMTLSSTRGSGRRWRWLRK